MPTLLEHLSSPPVFSGVRVTRSLVLYVCFVFFLLAIVLSFSSLTSVIYTPQFKFFHNERVIIIHTFFYNTFLLLCFQCCGFFIFILCLVLYVYFLSPDCLLTFLYNYLLCFCFFLNFGIILYFTLLCLVFYKHLS